MSGQNYALPKSTGVNKFELGEVKERKVKRFLSTKTRLMIASALCVLVLCAVIVLAIFLAQKYQKYNEREEWYLAQKGVPSDTDVSKICLTHSCIQSAYRINRYLDPNVSPCDNFYQFTCGGWEKNYQIPFYNPSSWSVVEDMAHSSLKFFKEELEKPLATSSYKPDIKARTLYGTCMDTKSLESTGLSEARKIIDDMGGMSFNLSESYPDFDLTERLIQLSEIQIYPLFKLEPIFHQTEPNQLLLNVAPPEEPLLFSRKDSVQLWEMFAKEVIKQWDDLYKDETPPAPSVFLATYTALNDIKEALDNPLVKLYNPAWNDTLMTVQELQVTFPMIDWVRLFDAVLPSTPKVISVSNRAWFIALEIMLSLWDVRALDNTLKFSFVMKNLVYFPYKYQKMQDTLLNRLIFGNSYWYPEPRWVFCVEQIKTQYPLVMAQWYVADYVENEDEVVRDVDMMIENIRSKYIQILEVTELLDRQTRDFAIKKIKALDKQVAFPSYLKNLTLIAEVYDHMVANANSSFFMNIVDSIKAKPYNHIAIVGTLSEEDWNSLWLDYAYVVNGFYSSNLNRFTIMAGILQGAFYDLENPKYLNYGSMGFTIGHEFTHGFDDTGRHYGLNGLVHSWWSNASEKNYEEAKQCYRSQYSKFEITVYGSNDTYMSNGNVTLDENIADNGAEYVVYQAYEEWVKKNGEEKLLPTPYLDTWQKQYYVAQAQGWCGKYTSAALSVLLDTLAHSPKEARVNGMVQNSVRFADIFQCPVGSKMNPKDKCKLW